MDLARVSPGDRASAALAFLRDDAKLPFDLTRGPRRSARCERLLPAETAAALRRFSQARGVTVFMVLLAAFAVVLKRFSQRDALVIACPVAGRDSVDSEAMIGMLVNTLPLRFGFEDGASFAQVVDAARRAIRDGLDHAQAPFVTLIEGALREPSASIDALPLLD